ncbi:hypothetical protein KPATCC21470_6232 [Kitasatospora purpeofusca]
MGRPERTGTTAAPPAVPGGGPAGGSGGAAPVRTERPARAAAAVPSP